MGLRKKYKTAKSFEKKANLYKVSTQNKPTINSFLVFMGIMPSDVRNMKLEIQRPNITPKNKEYYEDVYNTYLWHRQRIISFLEQRMNYPPQKTNVMQIYKYLSAVDKDTYVGARKDNTDRVQINLSLDNDGKNKI